MQRGRKSSAANLVRLDLTKAGPRLTAPSFLTKDEEALFTELVAACDHQHLNKADMPMLISFVQVSIKARKLASKPDKIADWEKLCRLQMALARSLRLTVQSRVDPKSLSRHKRDQRFGPVPWANANDEPAEGDDDDRC